MKDPTYYFLMIGLAGCGKSARPVGTETNLKVFQSVTPSELGMPEIPRKRAEGRLSEKGEVVTRHE